MVSDSPERKSLRVLICGGRDFADEQALDAALDQILEYTGRSLECLISGGAPGADRLAEKLADHLGVPIMVFPAPWAKFGRSAGPVRNGWMLRFGKPDVVLAMPGGKGTQNMIAQAAANNIPVVQKS